MLALGLAGSTGKQACSSTDPDLRRLLGRLGDCAMVSLFAGTEDGQARVDWRCETFDEFADVASDLTAVDCQLGPSSHPDVPSAYQTMTRCALIVSFPQLSDIHQVPPG